MLEPATEKFGWISKRMFSEPTSTSLVVSSSLFLSDPFFHLPLQKQELEFYKKKKKKGQFL